jgi:predicted  nucleic acid-binding Zn-ribbon protein
MTSSSYRAYRDSHRLGQEPDVPVVEGEEVNDEQSFDRLSWSEIRDVHGVASEGGRQVLGWALSILALAWTGYTAWSAGRTLAAEPLTSPLIAQWIAILAGPLALMGLVWLMFGRTRRKESERFTRSVITMRTEARALQDVLAALQQQVSENHRALGVMAGDLMGLGDQASTRLGAITADLNEGSRKLAEHGSALDRAAESARTDIGVLLADLPQAEDSARRMAETLRDAGRSATEQAATFERQVGQLASQAQQADNIVQQASQRLLEQLGRVESAGSAASQRIADTTNETGTAVDSLLSKAAEALSEIQGGIELQAAAVTALVMQSQAGIGRAGMEASEQLNDRLATAGAALDSLTSRIAEQDRSSQRMMADLDTGLAALDERFLDLARSGDERASRVQTSLSRLRDELEAMSAATEIQDSSLDALAERTARLREGVDVLGQKLQGEMGTALAEAEAGASRLLASADAAAPQVGAMRDAAVEAANRIESGASNVEAQQQRLAALMTSVDLGVSQAEERLAELSAAVAAASAEADRLSSETGPALVSALLQVKETAAHAAERAREAISAVIPQSADALREASRKALSESVSGAVNEQLTVLSELAERAVTAARNASDRLTRQMLTIGKTTAALEARIDESERAREEAESQALSRRVDLLMESLNSTAIDVTKILSNEITDTAWAAYLKGDRGVFTRRAVRLLSSGEARQIVQHYEAEPEFREQVNRYIHDFEAMLRRILAERDGNVLGVTLLSSDMGKLYVALAQALERLR